jgi:hypothetical protein
MSMHLILILINNSNVIMLKKWTKPSLYQEAESDYMYSDDSESSYTSQSQFYFLRMNNQYVQKYSKIFKNI